MVSGGHDWGFCDDCVMQKESREKGAEPVGGQETGWWEIQDGEGHLHSIQLASEMGCPRMWATRQPDSEVSSAFLEEDGEGMDRILKVGAVMPHIYTGVLPTGTCLPSPSLVPVGEGAGNSAGPFRLSSQNTQSLDIPSLPCSQYLAKTFMCQKQFRLFTTYGKNINLPEI